MKFVVKYQHIYMEFCLFRVGVIARDSDIYLQVSYFLLITSGWLSNSKQSRQLDSAGRHTLEPIVFRIKLLFLACTILCIM